MVDQIQLSRNNMKIKYDVYFEYLPLVIKIHILKHLNRTDFINCTSTCTKLRECFFLSVFWREVKLIIKDNKLQDEKLDFHAKLTQYLRRIEIQWPSLGKAQSTKYGNENAKFLLRYIHCLWKGLRQPLRRTYFTNLEYFKLSLQNPICYTENFIYALKHLAINGTVYGLGYLLKNILTESIYSLKYFSTGFNEAALLCHSFDFYVKAETVSLPMEQLHIATKYKSGATAKSFISKPVITLLKCFTSLTHLSIDWNQVCTKLIDALNNRHNHVSIYNLQIVMHSHTQCYKGHLKHPTKSQWDLFCQNNPAVETCLTFVGSFKGICPSVQLICNVKYIKIFECLEISTVPFRYLIHWHMSTLKGIVFLNIESQSSFENAKDLWTAFCFCENIEYITVIGHFLEEDDLLIIASRYGKQLKKLLVTKQHIIGNAEASSYLIPLTGMKMKAVKALVSEMLKKKWEPLKSFKQPPLCYVDCSDHSIYF